MHRADRAGWWEEFARVGVPMRFALSVVWWGVCVHPVGTSVVYIDPRECHNVVV